MSRFLNLLSAVGLRLYNVYAYIVALIVIVGGGLIVVCLPGVRVRRRSASWVLKLCFALLGIRWRVHGLSRLPAEPCIVVANHISYLDGPILQMLLPPRISFAIMAEVKGLPPAHWLLTRLGSTFITRGNVSGAARQTRDMLRKLRAGECIGIFAEGRMGRPNQLQRFQRGAFMLATHEPQVPVVPVLLRGPEYMMPDHSWLFRPARISVTLLSPEYPRGEGREAAHELSERVHDRLLGALKQAISMEQG